MPPATHATGIGMIGAPPGDGPRPTDAAAAQPRWSTMRDRG
jgi:hypothetical protein